MSATYDPRAARDHQFELSVGGYAPAMSQRDLSHAAEVAYRERRQLRRRRVAHPRRRVVTRWMAWLPSPTHRASSAAAPSSSASAR